MCDSELTKFNTIVMYNWQQSIELKFSTITDALYNNSLTDASRTPIH